jgi:hypothetical protein
MVDYSAMKSYLQKNNLHYFTFSPNSEKLIKLVIRHFLPDTPVDDISSSLEDLGFNVINVRQTTATQTAPVGKAHVEPLFIFPFTLTINIISQRDI